MAVSGIVAFDADGDEGIDTVTPTAWRGDHAPARLRVSRGQPDQHGAQHFVVVPYEYGMSVEYPGVVEVWCKEFSVHSEDGHHGTAGSFWVGDEYDLGGLHVTAHADSFAGHKYTVVASEMFTGASHGGIRFVTRIPADDHFEFMSGPAGDEVEVARITGTGKVLATGGIGVGNSEPVIELGSVIGQMQVFDAAGNRLGYVPIHESVDDFDAVRMFDDVA